ncbi:hypothetical protein [Streptomyces geranii]|uniref:hypothetical protein n=1 Tax=Streptomyces geranii TaxID=2058923 RepID=UPI000D02CCF0|nr:hypothetical protein [Streptomyces geranii]
MGSDRWTCACSTRQLKCSVTFPDPKNDAERAANLDGEDVRIASVGQLSAIFFANRALRHLSVLDIVWLG